MRQIPSQIYRCLPPSGKSLVASLYGKYMYSVRFGGNSQKLVQAAQERERWSSRQWQDWQNERLSSLLTCAAMQVPFYRQQWRDQQQAGDGAPWENLSNWPILDKQQIRTSGREFLADDSATGRLFTVQTSGTTGTPLKLWRSQPMIRELYALSEARERGWHGVSIKDRWATLGGQLVTPVSRRTPPFWVWNRPLRQLYMSSYHLAPDLLLHYLDALARYRVTYLWGYSSALVQLAEEALRRQRTDLAMKVVITNGEPLFDDQRETISRAFSCPVRETYGMAEAAVSASECEAGRLHVWPEAGIIEILDGETSVPPGEEGDIVATGLLNTAMPLIRYRTGDRGVLDTETCCPCGRSMPVLKSVEGRRDDCVRTADGRTFSHFAAVLDADLPVSEAQIIQHEVDRLSVRYVSPVELSSADRERVTGRIRQRMGDVIVAIDRVDSIPRTSRGKFRKVVCELPNHD